MTDVAFRIGHLGFITKDDDYNLIDALHDMNIRELL